MIDLAQIISAINPEDTAAHILAGRRAALAALVVSENVVNTNGPTPETMTEATDITVTGGPFSIVAGIDAAVLETITRLQAPVKPKRKWWKVWA